jgi:hypothetical protein
MIRTVALSIATTLAVTAAHAAAWPPKVVEPDWIQRPSGVEIDRVYPSLGTAFRISGYVMLRCNVTKTGVLEGCIAAEEEPTGLGFGAAALKLQGSFRLTPRYRNGVPVDGGAVSIPVRFAPWSPERPVESAPQPGPEPTAAALALARRLVQLLRVGESFEEQAVDRNDRQLRQNSEGVEPAVIQRAISAYRKAAAAEAPRMVDAVVRMYARELSEQDLKSIIAFEESEAGRNFRIVRSRPDPDLLGAYAAAHFRMQDRASRVLQASELRADRSSAALSPDASGNLPTVFRMEVAWGDGFGCAPHYGMPTVTTGWIRVEKPPSCRHIGRSSKSA